MANSSISDQLIVDKSQMVPDDLIVAGGQYRNALLDLGLDPEGLFWAFDEGDQRFRLWMVWSGLDLYGPYSLSKLLFKAYMASALPQSIDPFAVYVVTPSHKFGRLIEDMNDIARKGTHNGGKMSPGQHIFLMQDSMLGPKGLETRQYMLPTWIYNFRSAQDNVEKVANDWRAFNENVVRLAA